MTIEFLTPPITRYDQHLSVLELLMPAVCRALSRLDGHRALSVLQVAEGTPRCGFGLMPIEEISVEQLRSLGLSDMLAQETIDNVCRYDPASEIAALVTMRLLGGSQTNASIVADRRSPQSEPIPVFAALIPN